MRWSDVDVWAAAGDLDDRDLFSPKVVLGCCIDLPLTIRAQESGPDSEVDVEDVSAGAEVDVTVWRLDQIAEGSIELIPLDE